MLMRESIVMLVFHPPVSKGVRIFALIAISALTIPLAGLSAGMIPQDSSEQLWCEYPGKEGLGKGKNIVLISGDDEYRSEETMPQLGKILSQRHGFHCTVLFPIDPKTNTIKPDYQRNIPGMKAIESADAVIIGLRFRQLPDAEMKYFVDYLLKGKSVIAIRTSTHAFKYDKNSESKFKRLSWDNRDEAYAGGFGQQILGDTWVSHHGRHKKESTRGVIAEGKSSSPLLRGVSDVWGPTDVYGIKRLPKSANVLMLGQVLEGMKPTSKPVEGKKNDPMMPLVWTKDYQYEDGQPGQIFCTTMGSSTDLECEDFRRLLVNATFWACGMESSIPEKANVDIVGEFKATPYGFGNYIKGRKPSDFDLK